MLRPQRQRPVHWREGIHPLGPGDVITVRVVEAERPDPGMPTVSVPQS